MVPTAWGGATGTMSVSAGMPISIAVPSPGAAGSVSWSVLKRMVISIAGRFTAVTVLVIVLELFVAFRDTK